MNAEEYKQLTHNIIGCAIEVHRILGPGLLESVYRKCLKWELESKGYHVREEVPVPVVYKGHPIDTGYRMDLLVEDVVIVECKCVDAVHPIHTAQLRSHIVLANRRVGLVINFRELLLTDGIKRVVNEFPDTPAT